MVSPAVTVTSTEISPASVVLVTSVISPAAFTRTCQKVLPVPSLLVPLMPVTVTMPSAGATKYIAAPVSGITPLAFSPAALGLLLPCTV